MCIADVMVPPLEPTEYLYELRAVAENIIRERLGHSEVHHAEVPHYEVQIHECGEEVTNGSNAEDVVPIAEVVEIVEPKVGPDSTHMAKDVLATVESVQVGPAWEIPMTQEKSLADLPSQLDLDWQDQPSLTPTPSLVATRNLGQELEAAASEVEDPPVVVAATTFADVNQLAQDVVMEATE